MAEKKRRRGRPTDGATLDPGRIIREAFKEIGKSGLRDFSLRSLARRLQCQPMSLYHYFPSKAHLVDAMVDEIVSRIELAAPDAPWEDRLRIAAQGWRQAAISEPAFYPVFATHRLNTRTAMRVLEGIISIFSDAGFDVETGARCFRATGYYLLGAALDEVAGYDKGTSSATAVPEEIEMTEFPKVAQAGKFFVPEHYEKTFELGLEALISQFASLLGARRNTKRKSAKE